MLRSLLHTAACPLPARPACVQGPHPPNSLLDEYMDAVTFQGKCAVSFQRVPVPQLQLPGDVVVRIDLCGLCGSDLHPYHCREEGLDVGTVMGHEFVGHVVQAGACCMGRAA